MFRSYKILLDVNGHMYGEHMMNWWGISFMGFYMLAVWALFIAIAFLVYKDAQERGMVGLLWFILVLIPGIGIIALLIYLIIREERVRETSPASPQTLTAPTATKRTNRCPYCGAKNPLDAEFCINCGTSLEP